MRDNHNSIFIDSDFYDKKLDEISKLFSEILFKKNFNLLSLKKDLSFYFEKLFLLIEKLSCLEDNQERTLFYFLLKKNLYQNLSIYYQILKINDLFFEEKNLKDLILSHIVDDYKNEFYNSRFIFFFLVLTMNDINSENSESFILKNKEKFIKECNYYFNYFFQFYFSINFFESTQKIRQNLESIMEYYGFETFFEIKESYMFFFNFDFFEKKPLNFETNRIKKYFNRRFLIKIKDYRNNLLKEHGFIYNFYFGKIKTYFFSLNLALEKLESLHGEDKLKKNINFLQRNPLLGDLLGQLLFDHFLLYAFEKERVFPAQQGNLFESMFRKKNYHPN